MCSFIFLRSPDAPSDEMLVRANRFSRYRGPDRTTIERSVDELGCHLTLLHNLLDISGTAAPQPIVEQHGLQRIMAVFNGEVYNFRELGDYSCDTKCILPCYRSAQGHMARLLDGEFAVVTWDSHLSEVTVAVDPFLTKPVYWSLDENKGSFAVGTCGSSLRELGLPESRLMRPNSMLKVSFISEKTIITEAENQFAFSLNQDADCYDAWNSAFLDAVRKRALHGSHRPVVYLSSGYDSGAICAALNELHISYDTFSIAAGENRDLLEHRIDVNRRAVGARAFVSAGLSPAEVERIRIEILETVEPFRYAHEDRPGFVNTLQGDGGAVGAFFLAEWARREGRVVNLSGAGADEIISDYGWNGKKIYHHSQFGGLFPENLEKFFPWRKFYDDTQRSYLFKEEFILGRHGIEGRYPFLDRNVVQQFLSLSPRLKNRCYKAPIQQFLESANYPFEVDSKRGFAPAIQISQSLEVNQQSKAASILNRIVGLFR
jgi:asparagine synthetase B (glutamine-hydrolysing)